MGMLTLIRDVKGDKAVLGKLYFNGGLVCYTLENAAKAIPPRTRRGVSWSAWV